MLQSLKEQHKSEEPTIKKINKLQEQVKDLKEKMSLKEQKYTLYDGIVSNLLKETNLGRSR